MNKICNNCKINKLLTEFGKSKSTKDGYQYQCKLCAKQYHLNNIDKAKQYQKEYQQQYRINHKDKARQYSKQYVIDNPEYHKQWRIDNPEYHKQYAIDNADKFKKWRIDNPEYYKQYAIDNADKIKQYYIDNKDKLKKYQIDNKDKIKQYQIDNKDKSKEYQKQYQIDNKDKSKEYQKQYRKENADKLKQQIKEYFKSEKGKLIRRAIQHKRRILLKTNTPSGNHWKPDDIQLKLKLQHSKCVYCKTSIKKYYEIDHIIPVSKGGSNEPSNIQLLCKKCNRLGGKGAKLPDEFAKKHGMLF